VVLQDDFSDPATSQLPQNSTDPKLRLSIESGEYRVHTLDPAAGNSLVRVPVLLANGSISVEARFEGDATDRLLILGCRVNDSANGSLDVKEGYFLLVLPGPAKTPGTGSMQQVRRDGRKMAPLSQPRQVATNPGDRLNRLELSCIGDTISAYINDKPAGESRDNTYGAGLPALGIGVSGATVMTSDARFHNLEVTER